ncbi:hypothetical protein M2459_001350 [Parabacteroides sp. PF5-5]|uniref:hypothetical protein n=1 Tax=unclassified Parabacteroides TaxID=2649774 RepID=UPI002476AAFC|nr:MULTISPECIES: hypothetical protein [unclassified Parabacteroides]MDH6304615.1 hypothetical protein [Parabacteroides sp. PH5-39]MDH6315772.1 hypothetical protein [Parabacteroides sp. PF5-13]MDH6319431.1 hypothetical protein [Parabacteroides sp. PH5-13]MDH6323162.1 hypothetical protein [Parabacteroides sp. PH5-8]MDH6326964.1 hypothetical protein [Parabacteroides sp. PH5-41]
MLYVKENPTGIDKPIQKLQNRIWSGLLKAWGIAESDYNSFCRVYINRKDGGYIPEFYMGRNEYRETFFDDKVYATSFFVMDETVKFESTSMRTTGSLIFCVNLERLKSKVLHRADEEVRMDVVSLCNMYGFTVSSIQVGIKNVFREFSQDVIKFTDMHPFHCFRINMNIIYDKC